MYFSAASAISKTAFKAEWFWAPAPFPQLGGVSALPMADGPTRTGQFQNCRPHHPSVLPRSCKNGKTDKYLLSYSDCQDWPLFDYSLDASNRRSVFWKRLKRPSRWEETKATFLCLRETRKKALQAPLKCLFCFLGLGFLFCCLVFKNILFPDNHSSLWKPKTSQYQKETFCLKTTEPLLCSSFYFKYFRT